MKKIYKSKSSISINVVLKGKQNLHVSFAPSSDGTSSLVTSDPVLQAAIERHYRFGSLFYIAEAIEPEVEQPVEDVHEEEPSQKEQQLQKVSVSDFGSARDYLADQFGVSRTSTKSIAKVIEVAKAHGVEFVGLSK